MNDEIRISLRVDDPASVSPRLRDALLELAEALEEDGLAVEPDVTGYAGGLTIGTLVGPSLSSKGPPPEEESCWGFCRSDAACGGQYCWWFTITRKAL